MNRRLTVAILGLVVATTACGGCGRKKEEPDLLVGKGSTFVLPLMVQWSYWFEKSEDGCKIDYWGLGSGSGIRAFLDKKTDFACTDAPLTDAELAKAREAGGEVVHVPLVLGAVVPAYNLTQVTEPLRFSGPVLADIFLGKIKKWNEPALRELNPHVADRLPDQPIRVVHRKDGSGTTYIWVDYLAKVSPAWKQRVGVATEVTWPTGTPAVGNDGVARYVKETPGSLGYVELSYVFRRGLRAGLVRNREGEFVEGSLDSVAQAASQGLKDLPSDLRYSLTDAPGKGAYPISGTTWAVAYVRQPPVKARHLVSFLYWALDKGQEEAEQLFYLRLPGPLRKRALAQAAKLIQAGALGRRPGPGAELVGYRGIAGPRAQEPLAALWPGRVRAIGVCQDW